LQNYELFLNYANFIFIQNTLFNVLPRCSTLFNILPKYLRFSLVISPIFRTFVPSKYSLKQKDIMQQNQCLTMGRTQLAQMYFPYVLPQTAWQKLRSLLSEDPDLAPLASLRRRTFLPAEVNIIYQHLGQP
jgi:hypothetical protein